MHLGILRGSNSTVTIVTVLFIAKISLIDRYEPCITMQTHIRLAESHTCICMKYLCLYFVQ